MKKPLGAVVICFMILMTLAGCARSDISASSSQPASDDQEKTTDDQVSVSDEKPADTTTSETQSTADSDYIRGASSPSPEPASKPVTDCETEMRKALHSSDLSVFVIQSDIEVSNTAGVHTQSDDSSFSSYDMNDKETVARLRLFLSNKTIRITKNLVFMDDSAYTCSLQELSDGQGLGVTITEGSSMNVNQGELKGIIKGNTLSANVYVSSTTNINSIGNGAAAGGDITVSMKQLSKDEWPPLPVTDVKVTVNEDNSVTVNWTDQNPKGTVASYDIYRITDQMSTETKPIASASGTSYTDDSDTAKTEDLVLAYSVIAVGENGKQSEFSPFVNADVYDR